MDLELLRLFVEISRRGGFAAVARARNVDPSSVSRALGSLEHSLGLRLFQRSTRRMQLTEAGAVFLSRVEGLVDELDQAREAALALSTGPAGKVRLTASVAFGQCCIVPLLAEFRALYPDIAFELLFTDANLDLVTERVDLAVRLGFRMLPGVVGTKLFATRYRAVASPGYLETHAPLRKPRDLAAHKCLLFALPEFSSRWRFRQKGDEVTEVLVKSDIVVSSALALRECALAGLGPALLANWLIDDDIAAGALVDVFAKYEVTPTEFETAVWLLYPTRAFVPNKVRVTIDFLKARLGRVR